VGKLPSMSYHVRREQVRVSCARGPRAISGYLLCGYLGFGVPSILVGFVADRLGVTSTLVIFGVVIVLARVLLAARSDLRLARFGVVMPILLSLTVSQRL
jgi:hypothetical protein